MGKNPLNETRSDLDFEWKSHAPTHSPSLARFSAPRSFTLSDFPLLYSLALGLSLPALPAHHVCGSRTLSRKKYREQTCASPNILERRVSIPDFNSLCAEITQLNPDWAKGPEKGNGPKTRISEQEFRPGPELTWLPPHLHPSPNQRTTPPPFRASPSKPNKTSAHSRC